MISAQCILNLNIDLSADKNIKTITINDVNVMVNFKPGEKDVLIS